MALQIKNNSLPLLLIAIIAAIVFIPFIGNCPLFDWDEVNFAECAREMVVSGNYTQVQLNYQPFWEKPPFFIWLQALSMNIFGVNEFAARFPNAICSIVSLISLFVIGKNFHSTRFGILWCLLYAASLLPHFYFKSGIIDPWFNLFMFLSVYQAYRLINNPDGSSVKKHALPGGIFLGLAVLTKGPAALVIVAICLLAFTIWNRSLLTLLKPVFILFAATTLIVASSWFIVMFFSGHKNLILEFINYQLRLFQTGDAGHDGPFLYHFVALLIGCFPASLIFLMSYFNYRDLTPYQKNFRKIMLCLFWTVLILFSIVKTKIVHYSSLCYYPLTFVAAVGLVQGFENRQPGWLLKSLYWTVAGALTLAFTLIGFTDQLKGKIIAANLIKDSFALMNLEANGQWWGFEFLTGIIFFAASWLVYMAIKKSQNNYLYAGLSLHVLFITLAIALIVPKIELYTQHATIEFYKEKAKENCYVETHGFKSYAYLFYSQRKPQDYTNPDQVKYIKEILDLMESEGHSRFSSYSTANCFWIENGKIDRPGYIVVKLNGYSVFLEEQGFKLLYQKNGYGFYKRKAVEPVK